ncbi:hypothetical protein T35B1_01355 [Salinisphaera shabanensis T35B1]|jgi:hypothetical protein|uniref:DUF4398 domain-containing protein n=1 Tax=Salinisphaera shabanensis E1L3A TaxID=1033802 RepID=U2E286_9GAMM|nr:hypothetical protein [Salinisphaera shabanensis]ERJ18011.1 hypothetical protein SSPSH_003067 [Salinisphaera shabanensis E1L3A]
MPASTSNPLIRALAAGLLILASAGCASNTVVSPSAPDESVLAPAEQALAKARAAEADTFAPRVVDASRRRIATARDILYSAARANRELSDTERARVEALVEAAELDARSALTQTQAKAVQTKLAELQGQLDGSGAAQTEASP